MLFDDSKKKCILALEVIVDQGFINPSRRGNGVDAGTGQAALGEDMLSGTQNDGARFRRFNRASNWRFYRHGVSF
jgi:hypothetical protein